MANQYLLIKLTVFVFFAYISFLLTVQMTNTPIRSVDHSEKLVRDGQHENATDLNELPPPGTRTNHSPFPRMKTLVLDDMDEGSEGQPEGHMPTDFTKVRKFGTHQRSTKDRMGSMETKKVILHPKGQQGKGGVAEGVMPGLDLQTFDQERDETMAKEETKAFGSYQQTDPQKSREQVSKKFVTEVKCVKRILFWCDRTVRFDGKFYCNKADCVMHVTKSVNVRDLAGAEIVVFYHMIEKPWDELIRNRPPGQLWVFFSRESPRRCTACLPPKSYGSLFNISLTYLSDSDIVVPYGSFVPSKKPITRFQNMDLEQWSVNKSKHILWVASNCAMAGWDRTRFVRHLAEYTNVDRYGRCGPLKCPLEEKEHCQELFMQYKFYLALESNLCRDYITEKVWRNSYQNNLVPIVFGANRADYERTLPPNSFIFAEDFNSTRELAEFIDEVGGNKTRYGEYFRWRELGTVSTWSRKLTFQPKTFCRIVSKMRSLQSASRRQKPKTSVAAWWTSSCRAVNVLTDLKFTDRVN